jgi:uncharacterized protein (TIRG00374 family)
LKRLSISILITIVIIFILFTQISLKDLYILLRNIDPLWAIFGSAGYLLAILFQALRFKWLLHSKDTPFSELFRISILYNLSNMVLPSKLGELSYPYLLNKICGLPITEGLVSLIASRVYDLFIILLIFLFASIGFQGFFKINLSIIILLVCLLIGLTLLIFFYMGGLLMLLSNVLGKISKWIGTKNSKPFQWAKRKIHEMAEDFYAIKARGTFFSVTLTSLATWIMVIWAFYAFLKGFGIEISFLKVVFGSTIGLIASSLPISGLGNWGTLEVGWAVGFVMVGLSKEKAITTGFGVHIAVFILCAMIGIISWITLNLPVGRQER